MCLNVNHSPQPMIKQSLNLILSPVNVFTTNRYRYRPINVKYSVLESVRYRFFFFCVVYCINPLVYIFFQINKFSFSWDICRCFCDMLSLVLNQSKILICHMTDIICVKFVTNLLLTLNEHPEKVRQVKVVKKREERHASWYVRLRKYLEIVKKSYENR